LGVHILVSLPDAIAVANFLKLTRKQPSGRLGVFHIFVGTQTDCQQERTKRRLVSLDGHRCLSLFTQSLLYC